MGDNQINRRNDSDKKHLYQKGGRRYEVSGHQQAGTAVA